MPKCSTVSELVRNALGTLEKKMHMVSIYFLLLLLFVTSWNVAATAQSIVRSLPGFPGPLPFELETGYVGVGESNDYYFVKSERNPREDPLMVWITGGPGCTAFSGLVFEIRPIHFKIVEYDGCDALVRSNPNFVQSSFRIVYFQVSNIIFLDSPVRTGFSYCTSLHGCDTGDTKSAKQVYEFLRKWFINHPEFLPNPLYIDGDSYSGIMVPVIVQVISDGIAEGNNPLINLKGYVLGNPVTDMKFQINSLVPFAHGMGLISNELYGSAKKSCGEEYADVDPSSAQCIMDLKAVYQVRATGFTSILLQM
ncbi:hypothetical protein GIB67_034276 [Kingdonia uniflora]|uniref:Uncharacterized protein n=1 Tax=Kingdonia uniflora TaxID=39325 RepID=A0A7J7NSD3_9MAGN|nr:hypothetical protein GIB67_034276 [Kingdonia uniflora]